MVNVNLSIGCSKGLDFLVLKQKALLVIVIPLLIKDVEMYEIWMIRMQWIKKTGNWDEWNATEEKNETGMNRIYRRVLFLVQLKSAK